MVRYKLYVWILSCAAAFSGGWYASGGRLSNLEKLMQDMGSRSGEMVDMLKKAPTLEVYCTQKTNSLVDRECNMLVEQGGNKYEYKFKPYRLGTSRNNTLRSMDGHTTNDESSPVVTLLD